MTTWLDIPATVFAIAGSAMLALNSRYSRWGFACFLVSNLLWIGFGLEQGIVSLVAQNLVFTATSLLGIWRWFTKEGR